MKDETGEKVGAKLCLLISNLVLVQRVGKLAESLSNRSIHIKTLKILRLDSITRGVLKTLKSSNSSRLPDRVVPV